MGNESQQTERERRKNRKGSKHHWQLLDSVGGPIEQVAQPGFSFEDAPIGFAITIDRIPGGNQGIDPQAARGNQPKRFGQIPALGPAAILERIIDSFPLVMGIVTARTRSARNGNLGLLVEKGSRGT
jgi:hypothetical protein